MIQQGRRPSDEPKPPPDERRRIIEEYAEDLRQIIKKLSPRLN